MNLHLLALLSAAIAAGPTQAAVNVRYGNPDRFTDAGDRNNDPVKVMQALARHLGALGDKYLPQGTDLDVEVLDLDRAGRPRMGLPTEIRIVTGKGDDPCIDLRYTLVTGGAAPQSQRERVCDLDFMRRLEPAYSRNDPLAYEKRMLDEWFRRRFAPGATHPR